MRILGFSEVVLSVVDLPLMRDFYSSLLEFPVQAEACHEHGPEAEPGGEPTISFLKVQDIDTPLGRHGHPQLLVLIDHRRHYFARQRLVGHDPTRSTLNHLAFEIAPETYDAAVARLRDRGLEPVETEFPAMTARAVFFRDPESNSIELICHAPD